MFPNFQVESFKESAENLRFFVKDTILSASLKIAFWLTIKNAKEKESSWGSLDYYLNKNIIKWFGDYFINNSTWIAAKYFKVVPEFIVKAPYYLNHLIESITCSIIASDYSFNIDTIEETIFTARLQYRNENHH